MDNIEPVEFQQFLSSPVFKASPLDLLGPDRFQPPAVQPQPDYQQYKNTDKLAIVCMAPTSRGEAPYDDYSWDVWGLNEAADAPWFKRKDPTAWFQIHPKFDFMRAMNRNDPKHWQWLQEYHPFPIFMQYNFRDVPAAVRYPLEEVMDLGGMYLTSTPAMMLALGILMGYKTIGIWGVEMQHESEYGYQKPCMEYWLGVAKGLGIEVYLPPNCALLRGNLYAYEDLRAADRTTLGFRRDQLKLEERDAYAQYEEMHGRVLELQDLLTDPLLADHVDIRKALTARMMTRMGDELAASQVYGEAHGRLHENDHYIDWHDKQNIPDDRKLLVATELPVKENEDVKA
jgi:hypothetical protein